MSQTRVLFPELKSAGQSRRRFSWRYASRHFEDLGTVRVSMYIVLRDLIPAVLLGLSWFARHPRAFAAFPHSWRERQLSLLDLVLLVSLTLCWQMIAGGKLATGSHLVRKQVVGNLVSSLCCSIIVFAACCTHTLWPRALMLSVCFLVAASLLSLLLLGAACVSRWAVLTFVINKREVILVGSGSRAQALYAELMESPIYHVVGIVDDDFLGMPDMRTMYMGGIDRLEAILKANPVQIAYCVLPMKSQYAQTQRAITICEQIGVEVRHSTHLFTTSIAHVDRHASAHGMFAIFSMVRQDSTRYVKRAVDIVGALALMIFSAPIVAAAAIAIKITAPGPIFFSQERYGLNRRRFRIFKMRTMVVNAEALQAKYESLNELDGPAFKIQRDPRITPVGRFLRKTSIDELPQLWNVLRGDMSLVGPRPLAVRDVLRMDVSSHLRRFSVQPGITCLWQMSGRNNSDFETWIRQDLDYIDRWSLLLDVRILIGTVPAVLWGRGAM